LLDGNVDVTLQFCGDSFSGYNAKLIGLDSTIQSVKESVDEIKKDTSMSDSDKTDTINELNQEVTNELNNLKIQAFLDQLTKNKSSINSLVIANEITAESIKTLNTNLAQKRSAVTQNNIDLQKIQSDINAITNAQNAMQVNNLLDIVIKSADDIPTSVSPPEAEAIKLAITVFFKKSWRDDCTRI